MSIRAIGPEGGICMVEGELGVESWWTLRLALVCSVFKTKIVFYFRAVCFFICLSLFPSLCVSVQHFLHWMMYVVSMTLN